MNPELIKRIRLLVSEGKVDDALGLFNDDWEDNDIVALKARLQQLRDKRVRGILSNEQEQIETNTIVSDLLLWTEKRSEDRKNKETRPEKIDAETISLIKKKFTEPLTFYYLISAVPILTAIMLVFYFLNVLIVEDKIMTTVGFGSAFFSTVSGLPIREILKIKDKIYVLDILLLKANNIKSEEEIEKINHLVWSIIESTLLKSQTNG
ncbi:hypothetical protein IT397_00440 [Candidatus Nomurabacteria bacterium]|nr:hypothetical protein [Candidatus Nomurabacteria bacterium]